MTPKPLIAAILTLTILASGIPSFLPEDADRNDRIDLRDAVMGAKDFKNIHRHPEKFVQTIQTMISAFYYAAGLKTVIKADRSKQVPPLTDTPYLISKFTPPGPTQTAAFIHETHKALVSRNIEPETPPPEIFRLT